MTLSSEQARQIGRIGAHSRWAKETNRTAATSAARTAFMARFDREVDPDGVLTPTERAKRADHAMKAHMARLAMKRRKAS